MLTFGFIGRQFGFDSFTLAKEFERWLDTPEFNMLVIRDVLWLT